MINNKLISIIIPVYNAESTLHHCIDSILNQSYKNLEIIMINDGSIDSSGEICDHYAQIDHRVKVIHQDNCGPSHARNAGIKQAAGHYIQFADADDHMHHQMTETLLNAMTDHVQLVICGYQSMYTHKNMTMTRKYRPSIHGLYKHADFMNYFGELYKQMLIPSPCNKLYNAQLIRNRHIHFMENMKYGEDLLFNLDYFRTLPNVRIIPDQLYNYLITSKQSLSRSFNEKLPEHQNMLLQKVEVFLREKEAYTGQNRHHIKVIHANQIVNAINNLFHVNSTYTPKQRKRQITAIIARVQSAEDFNYFHDSIQSAIIGQMMKYNLKAGIYYFFSLKGMMQYKLQPFFHFLKGSLGIDAPYYK